ncbi:MAG TPA: hypothetical protein VKI19_04800 [Acidimicrobiales bacterium]|nr:hypothetical protein [Acidimicrobiales bacterium]
MLKGQRADRRKPRRDDSGFTLLELALVSLLSTVVLAMAAGSLISLQNATSRNGSAIQEEQSASLVMAQMERDIRSASSISFPAGASPSQQLEMTVVNASGPDSLVLWVYSPDAATLTREVQVNGTFAPTGSAISHITNGATTPVFTYSDLTGADISSHPTSDIEACTTGLGVNVQISSTTSGVSGFQEKAEVALTNHVEALTAPGSGQCGSA